jgi:predicted nucleic acid-binding protein
MVLQKAVTNAGPLIYLALLGRFSLLQQVVKELYIPEAVFNEVVLQGAGQPGANETREAVERGWLMRSSVQNRIAVEALLSGLDLGEAEVIISARENGIGQVLLDDRAARAIAKGMGLSVIGTIGILLFAKELGIEIDMKQDLDLLMQHNFRISSDLYQKLTTEQQE